MNLESILAMLGSGAGVFLLKVYADWRQAKRGDTKDAVGAWQQIADRESQRFHTLETQITTQEKTLAEKDEYIRQLEHVILQAGLSLPAQ